MHGFTLKAGEHACGEAREVSGRHPADITPPLRSGTYGSGGTSTSMKKLTSESGCYAPEDRRNRAVFVLAMTARSAHVTNVSATRRELWTRVS
jgi:hypothetical protein